MLYAVINTITNKVVNVIEWDGASKFSHAENHILMQDNLAWIGSMYDPETQTLSQQIATEYTPAE